MLRRGIAAAIVAGLLPGCATQQPNTFAMTFVSVPAGAMLVQDGAIVGQMPMTLTYNLTPAQLAQGELRPKTLTAMWASGARTVKTPAMRWQPGPHKLTGITTFNRPASAPSLDIDMMVEARLRMEAEPSDAELAMWNQLGQTVGTAAALAARRR